MVTRIGTAGWAIPAQSSSRLPGSGSHLERYADVLNCVEINSMFRKEHRASTCARWPGSTLSGFQFLVKLPARIMREGRLAGVGPFPRPLRRAR